MGEILLRRLRMTRIESPAQEAALNLLVAAGHLRDRLDRIYVGHDITHGQYNVLRILRGAQPDGLPRCQIAPRMIERAPDLTRLIDRLEQRGLVERVRSDSDRRQSIARITRRGLEMLDKLRPALQEVHRELSQRLGADELRQLSRLCERLYSED